MHVLQRRHERSTNLACLVPLPSAALLNSANPPLHWLHCTMMPQPAALHRAQQCAAKAHGKRQACATMLLVASTEKQWCNGGAAVDAIQASRNIANSRTAASQRLQCMHALRCCCKQTARRCKPSMATPSAVQVDAASAAALHYLSPPAALLRSRLCMSGRSSNA